MYTFDSFGRRVRVKRRAMRTPDGDEQTNGGGDGAGGAGGGGAGDQQHDEQQLGFPANTAWRDMTPEQQSAYWRHQSQGWEQRAKGREDYDTIKAERDRLATANQTAEERALDEARREGENIGADRYLVPAVQAHFQRLTKLDDENTAKAFRHVDPKSFTNDKGDIDIAALTEFAGTFGTAGPAAPGATDPIAGAAGRQQQGGGGGTTSIAEATRQRAEELKGGGAQ